MCDDDGPRLAAAGRQIREIIHRSTAKMEPEAAGKLDRAPDRARSETRLRGVGRASFERALREPGR